MKKFYEWLLWTKWVEIPLRILAIPAQPWYSLNQKRFSRVFGSCETASTGTPHSDFVPSSGHQPPPTDKNLH